MDRALDRISPLESSRIPTRHPPDLQALLDGRRTRSRPSASGHAGSAPPGCAASWAAAEAHEPRGGAPATAGLAAYVTRTVKDAARRGVEWLRRAPDGRELARRPPPRRPAPSSSCACPRRCAPPPWCLSEWPPARPPRDDHRQPQPPSTTVQGLLDNGAQITPAHEGITRPSTPVATCASCR
jgi:hypothetical protein